MKTVCSNQHCLSFN